MRIDYASPEININSGLIIGGILSPILFNIFNHDLFQELKEISYTVGYADDFASVIIEKLNLLKSTNTIANWADRNLIKINFNKSEY
jgi:retron-type reverse transcriptase